MKALWDHLIYLARVHGWRKLRTSADAQALPINVIRSLPIYKRGTDRYKFLNLNRAVYVFKLKKGYNNFYMLLPIRKLSMFFAMADLNDGKFDQYE